MEKKIRLTMYLPEGIDPEDPGAILKHICSIMDEHAPADTGLDTDDPDISIDVFYLNEPSGAGNGISGDEPSSCGCGEDEEEESSVLCMGKKPAGHGKHGLFYGGNAVWEPF